MATVSLPPNQDDEICEIGMHVSEIPHSWLGLMARAGYIARGLVFVIIGIFAALAAIGARSRPADSKDALRALLNEPFGQALLAIIAVGLLCFAAWRFTQAVWGPGRRGSEPKSLVRRVIWAGSAFFYIGFAWVAVTMIFGADRTGNSDQIAHEWTAWLLAQPFGRWLLGAMGIVFLITSIGVAFSGLSADFTRGLEVKEEKREIVTNLGIAGFLARAFVFAMIGLFLLFAAISSRSSDAKGFAGALRAIQNQPYGSVLLGIISTLLAAIAEFERELIRERTGEGRKRAMANGVKFGRKPKLSPHQRAAAIKRRATGETLAASIARSYAVDLSMISRL